MRGYSLLLTTAFAPIIWGTTYIAMSEFLPPGRPLLGAALRALPAGLLMLAALAVYRRLRASRTARGRVVVSVLPRGEWRVRSVVLGALCIGLPFPLLIASAQLLPGGVAALASATGPFIVAGFSLPLLGLRPSRSMMVGAVLGILGVGLVVVKSTVELNAIGLVAAVAGVVSNALGTVLSRRWGRPAEGLLTMAGWQLTVGGLLLIGPALAIEGMPPALAPRHWAGLAYLAIVASIVAYTLWVRGVTALAPTQASMLTLLVPIIAAVLGWLLLGQTLTSLQMVGAALTLGAVALGTAEGVRAPRLVAAELNGGRA